MPALRIAATFENLVPNTAADAEVFVNTAAALARLEDVEVELLLPHNPEATAQDVADYFGVEGPLRIRMLPTHRRNVLAQHAAHALAATAAASGADVVYTRNMGVLAASLYRGQPAAFDHYRPWGDQIPPLLPVLRHLLGHPNFIAGIMHSEYARQSYARLGVPDEYLRVIHNGWSPGRMQPVLEQTEAREQAGLPADAFIAVYTGRINHKKGLDVVLDMARKCPEVLFVLVGSEGEGDIERAARSLPNVRIEGFRPFRETAPFLYGADVLIVPPSLTPLLQHGNTVLPLKLFLYLAAGRTILGPDSSDVKEILIHDENAWLVEPGDVDAAAEALDRLRKDRPLRTRLGRASREASQRCTWDARAERIRDFLLQRLAAHRAGERPRLATPLRLQPWLRDSLAWASWVATHDGYTIPTGALREGG